MLLALGFLLLLAALVVLFGTFYSIATLEGNALQGVRWRRLLWIYMSGAYYVTGRPIRALFGIGLTLSVILLYPVSFLLHQEFDSGLLSLTYLILSRSVSAVALLCGWPSLVFYLDTTYVLIVGRRHFRAFSVFLGSLLAGVLMLAHFFALLGFWPWEHW